MADTNVNGVDTFNITNYLNKLRAANESYGFTKGEKAALNRMQLNQATTRMLEALGTGLSLAGGATPLIAATYGPYLGNLYGGLGGVFNDMVAEKKYGEVEADPEDLGISKRFSETRNVEPYTTTDKYGDEVIKKYRTYIPQSRIDEKTALDKVKYYQQNPTKEMKEFADFVLNNTSVNSFLKNLRGK